MGMPVTTDYVFEKNCSYEITLEITRILDDWSRF
jgi:hypothetical protein